MTSLWLLRSLSHLLVYFLSISFCVLCLWSPGYTQLSSQLAGNGFGCPTVAMVTDDVDLSWAKCWQALLQAPIISCSIPASLVFFWYTTILALRYRSSGAINVRVSRDQIGVARNAPVTTRGHLFWMIWSPIWV
jgi:hypothetical protein